MMKKNVLALALGMIAPLALADMTGSIEYDYYDYQDNTHSNGAAVSVSGNVMPATALDLRVEYADISDTSDSATQAEVGITQSLPLSYGFSLYGRGAIGNQWVTDDDFAYFSIEPGIRYAVSDKLSLKTAYRFQDSFEEDKSFRTNTVRIGAEYSLTQGGILYAGYDYAQDQVEYNSVSVGYSFGF